jgi:outer membrane protein assembly factor BamB
MSVRRFFQGFLVACLLLGAWPALAGTPGTQKWVYPKGNQIAVGPDGTVYVTYYSSYPITAITPAGDYRWEESVAPTTVTTFPVIGENGTVYFGDGLGTLHARNANGTVKWNSTHGISAIDSAVIGAGGYIYCTNGPIFRITPDGSTDKVFTPPGAAVISTPAIGPDGTVYVGTSDAMLYALNPDLTVKWSIIGSVPIRHLAVGFDGTVYYTEVGGSKLHAFRYGIGGWAFTAGGDLLSAPVIGADGTIYVGCDDFNLYAVKPDGTLKWTFLTKNSVSSTPAVGADGIIYVGSSDKDLYALDPNGSKLWNFTASGNITLPIILAADGTVYVSSNDSKIYAVYSSSPGPAKSAWPMYQRDARHTGNTAYKWATILNYTGSWVRSSPALHPDGTIYVGATDGRLYAITPGGTIKWSFFTGDSVHSSPAVSPGAGYSVYVGSGNKLYMIDRWGSPMWLSPFTTGGVVSSPAVCADGNVVVGSQDHNLYKVNVDTGTQMWTYTAGSSIGGSPVIGPDGTIYVGSGDYVFHAVKPNGDPKWTFTAMGFLSYSAAIGPGGTVYVGAQNKLYALNPDGSQKWPAFVFDGSISTNSSPAIGVDGTIYVGCENNKLYAINPNGTYKWAFPTGGIVGSSPAIGSDGLIYVGSADKKLYVLKPDGSLAWAYPLWDAIWSSPAIGPDGTVYVGADLNFHAFYSTSAKLAHSSWPMFRHDLQHTARWAPFGNISFLPLMLFD